MINIKKLKEFVTQKNLGLSLFKITSSKFGFQDIIQQIIGATLFSSPFIITEEVWNLAFLLDPFRLLIIGFFTVIISLFIIYFSEYRKLKEELENGNSCVIRVPLRLISLLAMSYFVTATLLWTFGVLGIKITNLIWGLKLIVLASFFASIGAATADIIK